MAGPTSALRAIRKGAESAADLLKKRFPSLDFSVSESDDVIRLNKLVVPKDQRNQGVGSEFMRDLTQYADEAGKPIALTADGDFGGSKAGQRRFYKRAGFEDNKGKNKDFSISEGMVRRPQARAKSPSAEELVRLGYPESTAKKIASGELPMDQASRMARAREQGFDVDQTYYHGTSGDFSEFKPTGSNTNARSAKEAVWLSDDPEVAAGYARMAAEDGPISRLIKQSDEAGRRGDFDLQEKLMLQAEELEGSGQLINAGGQNIIPARVKGNLTPYDVDGASMSDLDDSQLYTWLSESTGDGVKIENFDDNADWGNYRPATHVAVKDPSNIRSVNAAFDPDQAGNPNLLAGSAAAAVGLGAASQSEDADAGVVTRGGKRLIEAFHGSPHKFDRFSMENIGTGEGAQAYGHGLYFADSEDVARGYRDDLNNLYSKQHTLDGEEIPAWVVAEVDAGRAGKVRADFEGRIAEANQKLADPNTVQPWLIEHQKATAEKTLRQLDKLESGSAAEPPGALYKVEIDVDPDTLLDWDKPLGEQPELRSLYPAAYDKLARDWQRLPEEAKASPQVQSLYSTGALIKRLEKAAGADGASQLMREAGYPGIRYLDGNSRNAVVADKAHQLAAKSFVDSGVPYDEAKRGMLEAYPDGGLSAEKAIADAYGEPFGTSNYVMFDEKPISIRERGMVTPEMAATMAAGGAAGVAATQDTPAWMQSAMQNIAPEEEAEIDRRITQRLRGAQYRKRSRQREDRYAGIRESLLSGVTAIDRSIGSAFQAIEMPYQGYLGLTRAAGGLMAGESPQQALMQGAQDAQQPIDQTAFDMGGAVTDATGSPMAGAVVNTAVNMGGF
jgi:hypothetical protein